MINKHEIPLFRLIVFFILGIICAINVTFYNNWLLILCLFLLLLQVGISFTKLYTTYSYRWVNGVLIFLSFFAVGYTLTASKISQSSNAALNLENQENQQLVIAEINTPPLVKSKTIKLITNVLGIKTANSWQSTGGQIILFIEKDSISTSLKMGDVISFEPKIENVPAPKNPSEFNYKKYLSYHLIHHQAFLKSNNWSLISSQSDFRIMRYAQKIRTYLINILKSNNVKDAELAVASALILGYKNDIDAKLKSAYANAGVMHILAVSGLHVGVLYTVFNFLLKFLEKKRITAIIKAIVIIFMLWSYAFITGLSPSIMRAATMFSFVVIAQVFNRKSNIINTLAASAFVILLINPLLIMEIGFQLSYLAVLGIVVIHPIFKEWIKTNYKISTWVYDLITVSLAAQIATFPIGLYYFHQFPNYFLIANIFILPLAILILKTGLLLLVVSFIPTLSLLIAKGLNYLIHYLNKSVMFIDNLPYSSTKDVSWSILAVLLVYSIIISLIYLYHSRKGKHFLYALTLLLFFLILQTIQSYKTINQKKLIVYNIPYTTAINFIDGEDNVLVSDYKLQKTQKKVDYHIRNNWVKLGVENEKVVDLAKLKKQHQLSVIYRIDNPNIFNKRNFFQFYNKKIVVIDNKTKLYDKGRVKVDFLIITKNTQLSLSQINKNFDVGKIIIDASNSNYIANKIIKEAKEFKIPYWNIIEQGAYTSDIN